MYKSQYQKKDLVKKVHLETSVSEEEIEDAIDYLMEEHFIIDYDKYQTLIHDEKNIIVKIYFLACLMIIMYYIINVLKAKIS